MEIVALVATQHTVSRVLHATILMVFYAKDMIALELAISAITEVDYTQPHLIAPHHDEK